MAIKIGITGGIGSGKSVVSHLLKTMDIPIYNTDTEAKRLIVGDEEIRKDLCTLVGEETYLPDGSLNRPYLAHYLFAGDEHAAQVNRIIHPHVKEDFRLWMLRHDDFPIVGVESAILIEAGFTDLVDALLMVYAPQELRIQRTIARDHTTEEAVRNRMARQMSDEEKRDRADYVICNDNNHLLIPQTTDFVRWILQNRQQD